MIESNGATSLTQVGDQYYLYDSTGAGPSLKISGIDHLASAAGIAGVGHRLPRRRRRPDMRSPGRPWEPISIRYGTPTTTATTSRISALCRAMSRCCEAFETSFHQDLNGDGQISPPATVLDGHLGGQTLTAAGGPTVLVGGPRRYSQWRRWRRHIRVPSRASDRTRSTTSHRERTRCIFSQAMFANVAAVLSDAQQVGSNVVITHDPQNVVTLQNLQLSNLHASDIHIL